MASGNYDVNAQMEDGNTGLHLAASNGFGEVCYVLQKHYKAKIDIQNQDENVVSIFLIFVIRTHDNFGKHLPKSDFKQFFNRYSRNNALNSKVLSSSEGTCI